MVSLHYTITKEDYIRFYTHVTWDARDRKKARWKNLGRQLVFFAAFITVYYFSGGLRSLSTFAMIIIGCMLLLSLLPLFNGRSSAERKAEEFTDDPDNAAVFSENYFNANDSGIEIRTPVATANYQWTAFVRKSETAAYYFLFLNTAMAIIVPKKAFASAAEKKEFDNLLIRNLSLEAEVKDSLHAGE